MSKVCKGECDGTMQVIIPDDGNRAPSMVCDVCGHSIDDWVKWDESYSKYWADEEKWASAKNAPVCLLGYFAHLFQQHYGCQFALSLSQSGLFKGPEMVQIRKILKALGGDANIARGYLEWVFIKKVSQRKRKITSLGFLSNSAVLNDFLIDKRKASKITRSTPIPAKVLAWMKSKTPSLLDNFSFHDCGDLQSFLSHFTNGFMADDAGAVLFVEKLKSAGVLDSNMKLKNWSE